MPPPADPPELGRAHPGRHREHRRTTRFALMALLAGSGTLHFVIPGPYRRIVPHALGHEDIIVALSGIAELLCAAALGRSRSRRLGGWLAALLFVAVFPANVQMAVDAGVPRTPLNFATGVWLRLPLQVPLIACALAIARNGPGPNHAAGLKTGAPASGQSAAAVRHGRGST